jgi:hypothetical protein
MVQWHDLEQTQPQDASSFESNLGASSPRCSAGGSGEIRRRGVIVVSLACLSLSSLKIQVLHSFLCVSLDFPPACCEEVLMVG